VLIPAYIDFVALPWVLEVLIPEFIKLLFLMPLFFYWIPSRVFPQIGMRDGYDKIMFNILYMLLFIETVVPLMLVFGIFSFPLFVVIIIFTKILFMKFYEKIALRLYFINFQNKMMITALDILDDLEGFRNKIKKNILDKVNEKWQSFSWIFAVQAIVIMIIFFYPAFLMTIRGFLTFTYGAPDTAQFFEWVSFLYRGELFYEGKTFGADFYGTTIFAFFVANLSNASLHIVFSLYPFFTVLFLLFGLFYFVQKMTDSTATGLFAVFLFGTVLMSPLIDFFAGCSYTTPNPTVTHFLGFNFYLPWPLDSLKINPGLIGMIPYTRNSSGLPYELSYVFFLPNLYFFIKSFVSDERHFIWWYGVTLMMMFTFHGGIAFYLVAASIPITIWAVISGKVSFYKLKWGAIAVVAGAMAGNAWLLSIFKYGGLGPIGAAAPIIDATLHKLGLVQKSADQAPEFISDSDLNFEDMNLLLPSMALFIFVGAVILLFIIALMTKRRFEWGAVLLATIGVLFIYMATIFGVPKLVDATRAIEALFLVWSIVVAFYFYLLVVVPLARFARSRAVRFFYSLLALIMAASVAWITPKWVEQDEFWKDITSIEYSDFAYCAYKIKRDYQPFTWTIISYNPEYAEILTKGYHCNTQDFLQDYDAADRFLRIPTPLVFIFLENRPHTYKGVGEWYYRWRPEIQENLQKWIMVYQLQHPGRLSIWYQSDHATIYLLDNKDYMDELFREEKRKKVHKVDEVLYHENNFKDMKK
jgi:hypothetical protein